MSRVVFSRYRYTNTTFFIKRITTFSFIIVILFLPVRSVFAYDDQTTHPALTQEIVNFYNTKFSGEQGITPEEKEWIIQGSILEDTPPRWINHFYDPIYESGWTGRKAGNVSQTTVQLFSRFGLTLEKPLSAVEWISSPLVQAEYARYEGNRTWKAAMDYYADGNKKEAYKTLGHALHLLEDMSVPDHTRDDTHAHGLEAITGDEGSPFEIYLSKYNPSNIEVELHLVLNLEKQNENIIQKQSITDYLIALAEYSNRYFFSKDTINDLQYENPKIIREQNNIAYGIDERGEEFQLANFSSNVKNNKIVKEYFIKDKDVSYPILDAYFARLAPKVILNGAGVIQLFKKQAADAVVNKEYHLYKVDTSSVTLPVVSLYGELVKIWNATQAFAGRVGGALENSVSAVQNFFTSLFGAGNDNLKPAGAVVLNTIVPAGDASGGTGSENQPAANPKTANTNGNQPVASPKAQNSSAAATTQEDSVKKLDEQVTKQNKQNIVLEKPTSTLPINKINELAATPSVEAKQCSFTTSQIPSHQGMVINEIAWMGSVNSANDEWIELKNVSNAAIDLKNWQVIDEGENIKVNLSGLANTKITPGQFFILERTDDTSAPGVEASVIYTGALSNANEGLRLFDGGCILIDQVLAHSDWPAGESSSRKTMERSTDLTWYASRDAGGTPKRENSAKPVALSGGGGGSGPVTVSKSNTEVSAPPAKLLITEIQITGGPGKTDNDFIELYNPNDTQVNLNGYRLVKRTKTGTSDTSIKSWTDDVFIAPHGYYLWANSDYADVGVSPDSATSASIANDNGVAIRFGPEDTGGIIDSIAWGEAQNVFIEGAVFGTNLSVGQSLQRKFDGTGYADTENNAEDFEISDCPSPKAEPAVCGNASNQAPSAFFVFAPQNPKINESVLFSVVPSIDEVSLRSSSTPETSYLWDFGDGDFGTTTENTINHAYASSGDFVVGLSAFQSSSTFSLVTTTISVEAQSINHPLMSEILFNPTGSDQGKEFIELWNPLDVDIDLNGWSLETLSGDATTTKTLIAFGSKGEDVPVIKSKGFYLVGFDAYSGGAQADALRSVSLSNSTSSIYLVDASGVFADSLTYSGNAPEGKSLERKALDENQCNSAIASGEFLGNGCDTDSVSDFDLRDMPNPQNSTSLREPRRPPTTPLDFAVSYASSSLNLHFEWQPSEDAGGVTTTIIYELKNVASGEPLFKGRDTVAFDERIEEVGREYTFSLQAFDQDGLASEIAAIRMFIPSILDSLTFSNEPLSTGDFFVEPRFTKYPFVPDIFGRGQWRILILYLNNDPVEEVHIGEASGLNPSNTEHALPIIYRRCTGSDTAGYSLILPDGWFACGIAGGAMNEAFDYSRIDSESLKVKIDNAKLEQELTTSDYVTVGYYAVYDWAIGRGWDFKLTAKDFTKYYFTESVGVPVVN